MRHSDHTAGSRRALRVLIDTTGVTRDKAGVGVYVINLIDHLIALPTAAHYFILAQSDDPDFAFEGLPSVTTLRVPSRLYRIRPLRILLEQLWLPVIVLWNRIEVVHSVHYSFPLISPRARRVVTIHDMTSMMMRDALIGSKALYYRISIAAAVRFAEKLIFVSESSKSDCERLFERKSGRFEVIHLGVDDRWLNLPEQDAVAESALPPGTPTRYILFLGTIEPRKNIVRLITAFAAVAKSFPEYSLVIAGMRGWKCEDVFVAARESGVEERIHFTGFVTEEQKFALLRQAVLFVYPSLYEGFGIPVLEAMACGVPVVTSRISSLPEVAGEAALLIDPQQTEEIEQALRTLLQNEDQRRELRERGLARSQLFSWKTTAERTLKVYESLRP